MRGSRTARCKQPPSPTATTSPATPWAGPRTNRRSVMNGATLSPRFRCALLSLILTLAVAPSATAAPGQLVPTFGDGGSGIKTQQIGDGDGAASGVALAPDGKLVTGINLVLADASAEFGVARFTAAGQLDTPTFNSPQGANYGGTAVEANDAFAVGVDSQGRAVMAARTSSDAVTVTRYTTAGLPDSGAFASPNGKL